MAKGLTSMFGTGQLCGMTTSDQIRSRLLANRPATGPSHNFFRLQESLMNQYSEYVANGGTVPIVLNVMTPCRDFTIFIQPA